MSLLEMNACSRSLSHYLLFVYLDHIQSPGDATADIMSNQPTSPNVTVDDTAVQRATSDQPTSPVVVAGDATADVIVSNQPTSPNVTVVDTAAHCSTSDQPGSPVVATGDPIANLVMSDQPMSSDIQSSVSDLPPTLAPSDSGRWCIVKYCDRLYPGKIQEVENNRVLVRALHPIGVNKFTNPRYVDELWYDEGDFIAFIDEPTKPSLRSRFVQVKNWDQYQMMFDA